ncbi:PREDICTED: uncharacterized protein LOC109180270 isoform X2 [Ipomoea nil]|uniref:uncharacterized protein LOC109180270 isoform X2 n=1 Tax=Ipomoea nil TaxID=35883 RepID=UPI00090178D4|nr:PREDICTED: uncharacterized protein LOC109180270 isoform X2 [Ipomoea nil]
MSGLSCPWISGAYASSVRSLSKFPSRIHHLSPKEIDAGVGGGGGGGGGFAVFSCCKSQAESNEDLKFLLHDSLDHSGIDTAHARMAREGFYSQIQKLSEIERETSISINRRVDLGKAALYIAAEDDSLISHSSVPLPVDDFLARLDDLSMDYCSHYGSSFRSSPEEFLKCLDRYLYIDKGFRRMSNQTEQRALYLHSVLTHRAGSAPLLSLIYSEVLKMLRLWGLLNFDAEVFFPLDHYSYPRGYPKKKGKESDQSHIMTAESLLVQLLKDLKVAFWPFQHDPTRSPFLRAADAANCSERTQNTKESALELASVKAAQHRLQRGVWTSVRFGDMRRALSACERLILLKTDPKETRDYGVLLYHCGFYKESLQYLSLYQDTKNEVIDPSDKEDEAVQKLMFRVNLILMEEGWSRPADNGSLLRNNSEPW